MVTYTGKKRIGAVSVGASAPVKIITNPSRGRLGYRVYNPDDTNKILIIEIQRGQPDPVAADFAEVLDFAIPANTTIDAGAGDGVDVWALSSSGTIVASVQELFGRRVQ